jgi:hypothetical protein
MTHLTLGKIQAVIQLLNNGHIALSDCTGLKCEETIIAALDQAEKIALGELVLISPQNLNQLSMVSADHYKKHIQEG